MIKILPLYFSISLLFGFMLIYIYSPEPKILIKQNNINADDQDENLICHTVYKEKTECNNKT